MEDTVGLLSDTPERTKAEFQRLNLRVTMTPLTNEDGRFFYRGDVVNSLPCLSNITDFRTNQTSAVDRSDLQIYQPTSLGQGGALRRVEAATGLQDERLDASLLLLNSDDGCRFPIANRG